MATRKTLVVLNLTLGLTAACRIQPTVDRRLPGEELGINENTGPAGTGSLPPSSLPGTTTPPPSAVTPVEAGPQSDEFPNSPQASNEPDVSLETKLVDQAACDKQIGKKIWYQDSCQDFDPILTAPKVFFHPDEQFFPSSVPFFLTHTILQNGNYVSKEGLGCADCTNPAFLRGQAPSASAQPPVYAMVVPKGQFIVDVVYWMFYPYNLGKTVCIGKFDTGFFDLGCIGKYKSFGHHVGDWEHITVRYVDLKPSKVYLSAHNFGRPLAWKKELVYEQDHPIVYSALGSHGLYAAAGDFTYRDLPNGDRLNDVTGAGRVWETWKNTEVILYRRSKPAPAGYEWLDFKGEWGNPAADCGIYETVSGECVLNSGPTGPAGKGAVTSDSLE